MMLNWLFERFATGLPATSVALIISDNRWTGFVAGAGVVDVAGAGAATAGVAGALAGTTFGVCAHISDVKRSASTWNFFMLVPLLLRFVDDLLSITTRRNPVFCALNLRL